MDETTAVKRLGGGGNSLHSSPPLTYIPLDIIRETILCRLPVKSLQRFRCVCNSWDSLVSKDLKFAKRHLLVSPKRQHLVTTWRKAEELTLMSCPFDSLNLHSNFDSRSTQLDYSPIISTYNYGLIARCNDGLIACCDGILCFAIDEHLAVLYNPSIRKVKKLPYIDHLPRVQGLTYYAFGYDPFIDNYKVVAVFCFYSEYEHKTEVHSYNLCTDSWKRIKDFPSSFYLYRDRTKHGTFMRDTVNWLTYSQSICMEAIVSLHLGKETYQEISLPDLHGGSFKMLSLYVMRDCLCLFHITKERKSDSFIDVWLMKEYGNKESWIKLFRIPSFGRHAFNSDIVYISEDDNHVLLVFQDDGKSKWVVYDFINDTITIKYSKSQDNLGKVKSKIYVESLISP